MRGVSFDIDATRDGSSFQGFKLFGTEIRTGDVQGEGNAKGSDPPEKLSVKALQCPRCKSMETKFFYFNNYNINQPRHFCRGCQRYWTAGGSLRNVPFGAGSRRSRPQLTGFVEEAIYRRRRNWAWKGRWSNGMSQRLVRRRGATTALLVKSVEPAVFLAIVIVICWVWT